MFLCLDSGVRIRYLLSLFESGIIVNTMSKRFFNAKKIKKKGLFGGMVRMGLFCPYFGFD